MNEIVHAHLPGVPLVHLPTPPPQIRAITDHVYFYLDRNSPLWPEFSTASSIGMHFSGDWPELAARALGDPGRPAMSDNDRPSTRSAAATEPSSGPTRAARRPRRSGCRRPPPAPPAVAGIQPGSAAPAGDRGLDLDAAPAPSGAPEAPAARRRRCSGATNWSRPNENPIMRAAGPLLLLLGRLRVALLRASFASLMEQVADAIKFFEKDIRSAGISGAAGQHRQIHSLRHRRRHRPEHPDRGPPRLDAIQHAQPLLRRAHRRRAVLRGARAAPSGPAGQLSAARAAARLPGARLPGHPPHLAGRRRPRCSRSSATSTRRCGGCGRRSPTTSRRAGRARRSRAQSARLRVPVWAVAVVVGGAAARPLSSRCASCSSGGAGARPRARP